MDCSRGGKREREENTGKKMGGKYWEENIDRTPGIPGSDKNMLNECRAVVMVNRRNWNKRRKLGGL